MIYKVLQILIFSISIFSYSQETKFTITNEAITDYLVTNCDTKTQNEIYAKTLQWIALTFKNTDAVIQAKVENELLRIEGYTEKFNGVSDASFMIEISFREGKYKFDPLEFTIINGINKFDLFSTHKTYFKNDGSVKSRVKETIEGAENIINGLNIDLKNHIMGVKKDKDDW